MNSPDDNTQAADTAAIQNDDSPTQSTALLRQRPDLVEMSDLDQFVRALMQWHGTKVKVLQHMRNIPEGSEVGVDDEAPRKMEGDLLTGFRMGIDVALAELGILPFEVGTEGARTLVPGVSREANG